MGTLRVEEINLTREDLKEYISKNRYSLLEISNKVGISQSTLSQIQNGYRSISLKNKVKLLEGLPELTSYLTNKQNNVTDNKKDHPYTNASSKPSTNADILLMDKVTVENGSVAINTISTVPNKESTKVPIKNIRSTDKVNQLCDITKQLMLENTPLTEDELTLKLYLQNKYNVDKTEPYFNDDQLNTIVEEIIYLVKKLS